LKNGITQCEAGLNKIDLKKGECDLSHDKNLCPTIETIYNQILTAKEKSKNLLDQINSAEKVCAQVTDETPLEDVLGVMFSLKETSPEFQKEMIALKEKWQADESKLEEALAKKPKPEEICAKVLPKFVSGKSQIENELNEIKSIQDNCQGSVEKKCQLINANLDKFSLAQEKGQTLLNQINLAENKCRAKTTLEELVPDLKKLRPIQKNFLL